MAVLFPDIYIDHCTATGGDDQVAVGVPGTINGPYVATLGDNLAVSITHEGDYQFTCTLTNNGSRIVNDFYFPFNLARRIMAGDGSTDVHLYPMLFGRGYNNFQFSEWEWAALPFMNGWMFPAAILMNTSQAFLTAATDWPPVRCELRHCRYHQAIFHKHMLIPGESVTRKAIYKPISTGTDPLWMEAIKPYKTWLKTKLQENGIEETLPDWMKACHGYMNVPMQNINPYSAAAMDSIVQNWKSWFPWIQIWSQALPTGGTSGYSKRTINPMYSDLAAQARIWRSQGVHVGYYSVAADLPSESGNYIPWDFNQTVGDYGDPALTYTSNSVAGCYVNFSRITTTTPNGFASVQRGDIPAFTSGSTYYGIVRRVINSTTLEVEWGMGTDSASNVTIDFRRYTGPVSSPSEFMSSWVQQHTLDGADIHYLDTIGNVYTADPLTVASNVLPFLPLFTEYTNPMLPYPALISGSMRLNYSKVVIDAPGASCTAGSPYVTLSTPNGTALNEWDIIWVGSLLNIVKTKLSTTSIECQVPFRENRSNQLWNIERSDGNPGTDLNKVLAGTKTVCSFPRLARYVMDDKTIFLGASNGDYAYWADYGEYWTMRNAFLLGAKFDLQSPGPQAFSSTSMWAPLERILDLRENSDWWSRDMVYYDEEGVSNIPSGIEVRRFVDKDGYNAFCIENWQQQTQKSFTFGGRSYSIPSDQLSIVDLRPAATGVDPPIGLHNIRPENVLFCYRASDADSRSVATYYASKRGVPQSNLLALGCVSSAENNIIDESDYVQYIENPIKTKIAALENGSVSGSSGAIYAIILGYNIPHGFYVGDNPSGQVVAVAGRLQRINHPVSDKLANALYDRRGNWKFYDSQDSEIALITSVIDAPTVDLAKSLVDRALVINNQAFVTGKIYVDPYGKDSTLAQQQYRDDLLDFYSKEVPHLGISSSITVDSGGDSMVPFLSNDSFYWGWFTPRYAQELFLSTNEKRVFLYNADDDGARSIKTAVAPDSSHPWCNLAIGVTPGYAACAGSVAAPGEDAYLRPRPFFEALQQGASVGEAFLFASPYLSWNTILVGDPLITVNFPSELPANQNTALDVVDNDEVIRQVKEYLEESVAYGLRQSRVLTDLLKYNRDSQNIGEVMPLMFSIRTWRRKKEAEAQYALFTRSVASWVEYIKRTTNLSAQEWLYRQNEKTSQYVGRLAGVSGIYLHPAGHWQHEFKYLHTGTSFEEVHFELQVSRDSDFSSLAVSASSYTSQSGWSYESEPNVFTQMGSTGFPSNLSGRRLRYTSPASAYLTTTEVYYIRSRVRGESEWATPQQIIIKR